MIRYLSQALLSMLLFSLPAVEVKSQITSEETASNFVNFNLNGINRVRADYPEYNGAGMTVSIKEFQYDTLDIDFSGRHIPHAQSSGISSAHSTLMATIIAGGGNSFLTGRGTAWASKLTSSSFLNIFPDPNSYFDSLAISVQNHSYGIDSIENFYGPIATAYDLQASQIPHLLHVFSIGNLGQGTPPKGAYAHIPAYANMTGEFKTAKNVLTMGVVDSFGIIDPFSSHGPTFDGRIKPELVAFGIDGSSAAAALATGSSLLLQQAYWEARATLPPAALVKALLINGAKDLGPPGVDHRYGYGNLDVFQSLETLLSGHYISDTLAFEENQSHFIQLPEGVEQFKLTLVWNDPPAAIHAEKALVNDLDLELRLAAHQQTWRPQILSTFPHSDSLALGARSGLDHLNNVEQIVVDQPAAGTYEININAFDFQLAEQAYHLVYEWDTLQNFQWLFPAENDQIVPNGNFVEQVYWKAPNDLMQTGELSYSFDGLRWETIASDLDLSSGTLPWSPPDTVARTLLRMQIGTANFISDTFTLSPQPFLQIVLNCADSTGLSWKKQAGIDQYQFYRLGDTYLEPYLRTEDTFLVIPKKDLLKPYIAFAPILPGGQEGVRSFAYDLNQQAANCYVQFFSGEIIDKSAHLYLQIGTDYNLTSLSLEKLEPGRYISVNTIPAPTGVQFEFVDPSPTPGQNTYRTKLTLANGETIYSPPVQLNYILPNQFKIYPNPISRQGDFSVLYNASEPELIQFQVYTALGAEVFSMSLLQLENALFADDFQSGLYFYRFVKEGQLLQSGKLIVR